jgi:hypothetical protein
MLSKTCLATLILVGATAAEASAGLQTAMDRFFLGSPIANYNPGTGNVTFNSSLVTPGPLGDRRLQITSDGAALFGDEAHYPADGQVELIGMPSTAIAWIETSGNFSEHFDGGNVVPLGTPAGALRFTFGFDGSPLTRLGSVVVVPEPSAFVVAAVCLWGMCGLHRRFAASSP